MSIFDESTTPVVDSPDMGHEETAAVGNKEQHQQAQETEVQDVQETQELDEQEAQEAETTTETDDQDSDPQDGHSELLAGKYKTVDELIKGYKELQRKFTQTRQQQAQESLQEPFQFRPFQQTANPDDDPNQIVWDALQRDPIGTINYLVGQVVSQKTAPLIEETETLRFSRNFEPVARQYAQHLSQDGAMDAYVSKIHEIAAEFGNPDLARNPSPRLLRMAAEELWGDSKAVIFQKGVQMARQQAEAARRAKQSVSVQTSKKPTETKKSEDDLIREAILTAGSKGIFD